MVHKGIICSVLDTKRAARGGPVVIGLAGPAGSGKSAVAEGLAEGLEIPILPFADPVKRAARQVFGWDGVKDERGRRLLQVLGTDCGRAYDPDVWVRLWYREACCAIEESRAAGLIGGGVIADDVRFENEADMIRQMGGLVVHLSGRGGLSGDAAGHVSEAGIDLADGDMILTNPPGASIGVLVACVALRLGLVCNEPA